MLRFNEYKSSFLIEKMNDSLESINPEETERHRKKYYDDSDEEGHFHKSDGLYVLDRDRTDLNDKFTKGNQVKLTSIQKLPDERGVIRYHGISGNLAIPMSHFKKPAISRAGKNQQKLEQEQINFLQKAIEEKMKANGNKPIKVKTPDGQIHEVAGIKSVQGGWPKADAYLHDKDGNPVHWMSLKGDKFQQWGGYKDIEKSPLMQSYIEKLQQHKEKIAPGEKYLPKGAAYHISLDANNPEQRELLHKSMYGKNHGGDYGPDNVHAIYSGNTIGFKETEPGIHELDPTALYTNRNDKTSDAANAKILLTYRAGMNQQGTGGRVMVSHMGNVGNSKDIDTGKRAVPLKSPTSKQSKSKNKIQKTPMPIAPSGEFAGIPFHSKDELL